MKSGWQPLKKLIKSLSSQGISGLRQRGSSLPSARILPARYQSFTMPKKITIVKVSLGCLFRQIKQSQISFGLLSVDLISAATAQVLKNATVEVT
jgi:hypothetical protein